jgi:hypothetical protein
MAKHSVGPGDRYYKTGRPSVLWTVERLKQDVAPAHAILIRLGDPATRITVSVDALSNPQYFRRSLEAVDPAAGRERR